MKSSTQFQTKPKTASTSLPQLELQLQPEAKELTPREVNRQISAELKAEKRTASQQAKGYGSGLKALAIAQKRHPNNPKNK